MVLEKLFFSELHIALEAIILIVDILLPQTTLQFFLPADSIVSLQLHGTAKCYNPLSYTVQSNSCNIADQ